MPRSEPYDPFLIEMLQDEERAVAYLKAALSEPDPRVFLIALRNVAQTHGGIGKIAVRSGLNRETLYRTLSKNGNPSLQSLGALLGAMGIRLSVEGMHSGAARKRGARGSRGPFGNVAAAIVRRAGSGKASGRGR